MVQRRGIIMKLLRDTIQLLSKKDNSGDVIIHPFNFVLSI